MRTLSAAMLAALYASETSEAFLFLLEISHAELAVPIRAACNKLDVVSTGTHPPDSITFYAASFDLSLPDETSDRAPVVTLTICNVDRSIWIALADLEEPPTVKLWVVASSSPNAIEVGPVEFSLSNVEIDVFVARGNLTFEPLLNEMVPSFGFTPDLFPALF